MHYKTIPATDVEVESVIHFADCILVVDAIERKDGKILFICHMPFFIMTTVTAEVKESDGVWVMYMGEASDHETIN